jgi:hypothetical protein
MTNTDQIIQTGTQAWLTSFIISYNICPFARREYENNRIRYAISHDIDIQACLEKLMIEVDYLDAHPETETTLLIFAKALTEFDAFLDAAAIAEQLLSDQGYDGIYQLAGFHPHYCFADAEPDDPGNYTNRSPYPMLHIIREASIEQALQHYPESSDSIFERNIQLTRQLGLTHLQAILAACL